MKIRNDRAKRIIKENKILYDLLQTREMSRPTEKEYIILDEKGKSYVTLYSPAEGEYFPINIVEGEDKDTKLVPVPIDQKRWIAQDAKETYERFKQKDSMLDLILPILAIFATGLSITIILYVSLGHVDRLISSLNMASGALQNITVVCNPGTGGAVPPH